MNYLKGHSVLLLNPAKYSKNRPTKISDLNHPYEISTAALKSSY